MEMGTLVNMLNLHVTDFTGIEISDDAFKIGGFENVNFAIKPTSFFRRVESIFEKLEEVNEKSYHGYDCGLNSIEDYDTETERISRGVVNLKTSSIYINPDCLDETVTTTIHEIIHLICPELPEYIVLKLEEWM